MLTLELAELLLVLGQQTLTWLFLRVGTIPAIPGIQLGPNANGTHLLPDTVVAPTLPNKLPTPTLVPVALPLEAEKLMLTITDAVSDSKLT